LARKAKKEISSVMHSLQRAYWKIVTLKPSTLAIAIVAIAVCTFLFGGGIYNLLQEPTIVFPYAPGKFFSYYPQRLNEQVILESAFTMILYVFGVAGLVLTYQSTKYTNNSRQAYLMLFIGLLLLIIAVLGIELGFAMKFGRITTS